MTTAAKPSLRARVMTAIVRLIVKRWPRTDFNAIVRRSRVVFNLPAHISFLYLRGVDVRQVAEPVVRGEWLIRNRRGESRGVVLYFHGGGYVSCSPASHRVITATLAKLTGCDVFALDYRLAPENPFPAAIDDTESAYRWLVHEQGISPHRIVFAGDSAGGGMVIAAMLRLKSRGERLPAAGVCFSPWLDLTGLCDYRNAESCAMFQAGDVKSFAALYLGNTPPETAEASPLFGDLSGLPPILIQASSAELLFDDAASFQSKALASGVNCRLSVYPALPHVWQISLALMPESRQAMVEAADFIVSALQGSTETKVAPSSTCSR